MPIALAFFMHYAYAILFIWVLVEQLGVPIPSLPILITAGTLSATHRVSLSASLLAVLVACVVADTIWYALGRRYGSAVLETLCRLSFEAETCVTKTEDLFHRRGALTLLFAKFVPGLGTLAAPIAGQTGMPYGRFVSHDLAGSVAWSLSYMLAGYFFGDLIQQSHRMFRAVGHFAVVFFTLMVLGLIFHRFWKQRRFLLSIKALRLDAADLLNMIETAKKQDNIAPFIVDLRALLDYQRDPRVLPGAIRLSAADLTSHTKLLPRDRDVILYCTCPSDATSGKVALQLHQFGVSRVRSLRGGFEGWRDAGYPLIDYVPPHEVETFTASETSTPVLLDITPA